jgi:hypothetical protein
MTSGQKVLFFVLLLTTFFGAFVYLCYLGIAYRMERASRILGPQILAREAREAEAANEPMSAGSFARAVLIGLGCLAAGIIGLIFLVGVTDHRKEPPRKMVEAAPVIVSNGCDLAGAIPNCKEVAAKLMAKAHAAPGNQTTNKGSTSSR